MKNIIALMGLVLLMVSTAFGQNDLKVELKKDAKPVVYIDGKKYDSEIVDLLDQSKIESINVIKGEQAIKDYNAPNGVIVITTKKASDATFTFEGDEAKVTVTGKANGDSNKDPMIVLDGKVVEKGTIEKLSPDSIESVDVIKGQKAIDKYNAPNGVIVIKTKN